MQDVVMELSQRFYFEAAHTLDRQIEEESSRRVHGHTYHAEVTVAGVPGDAGMIVDLGVLRREVNELRDRLDHRLLDEVPGLGPATLENLCLFIARSMQPLFPTLSCVRVWREVSGDTGTLRLPVAR